jgi:hypothetical protein
MGRRVVIVGGIPVLVPDDLSEVGAPAPAGLPPPRDAVSFDAAPTPDTGSATIDGPPAPPAGIVDPWAAVGGADAPVRTITAPPGMTPAEVVAAGPSDSISPAQLDLVRQGQVALVPEPAVAGTNPSAPLSPAKVDVPVGEAVKAGGGVLGAVGSAASDVAKAVLTPNGIVGDAPPPPEPEQPPMTPEESRAARQANLENQWNFYDQKILETQDPVELSKLAGLQNVVAEEMKGLALEERASADQAVAAEHDRIRAEAAEAIRRKEEEIAANQRRIDLGRQRAEHMIAQVEAEALKPVDRSLGLGVGKSILLAISVAIAGFGSALKGQGDKNPALDIVMRAIDKHVEDQWAHKKELWQQADRIAKGMGEFDDKTLVNTKIKEAFKAEKLIQASKEMERIAKDLPAAKRAAALEQAAALKQAGAKLRVENGENTAKWITEKEKIAETIRNNQAQNRASLISAGASATQARTAANRLKFEVDQFNDPVARATRKAELDKKLADAEAVKANATSEAEKKKADAEIAKIKAGAELQNLRAGALVGTVQMNPDGTVATEKDGTPKVVFGDAMQPDGVTPVNLRGTNDTEIRQTRNMLAAYGTAAYLIDDLVNLIDKKGWTPELLRSDAFKEKVALVNALDLENKDVYGLGALAGPDVGVLRGLRGGDVNQVYGDPVVGLRKLRKVVSQRSWSQFHQHSDFKGDVDDFEIPERTRFGVLEAAKNTPAEGLLRQSEGRLSATPGSGVTAFWEEENAGRAPGEVTSPSKYPNETSELAIMALAEQAAGADKNAEVAKVQLRHLLENEQDDPVRRFAAREVQRTGADLGIPGFTKTSYDRYEMLRRAPGNVTGQIPFVPPVGTQRGLLRKALDPFINKGD